MQQIFEEAIYLETIKQTAIYLLNREKKELKNIVKFVPDGISPLPNGVISFGDNTDAYVLRTPDGLVEIKPNDFVLETTDGLFYYFRLEIAE